jgi:tetraacyldisaccharide 4'-kinase
MPERTPGPLPGVLGGLLSVPYRWAIARRNRRFDRGRGVIRFDRVVVSVGNLSVGGTGKTPMVKTIVGWLLAAGHRPVIAMRGYGSAAGWRRGGSPWVGGLAAGAGEESDEAAEYRREFPHVPVVAQPDRAAGLIRRFGQEFDEGLEPSDCIVLDDGFQHRRIARDVDIVLIDAMRGPLEDRLLPAGWLREPPASLRRSTHTVITHAEAVAPADVSGLAAQVERTSGRPPAVTRHAWASVRVVAGQRERNEPIGWMDGRRVLAVCAIGNPGAFLRAARERARVVGEIVLRDHDPYGPAALRRIAAAAAGREGAGAGAEAILTTEKDWTKLSRHELGLPVAVPRLELSFDRGAQELRGAIIGAVERGAPE